MTTPRMTSMSQTCGAASASLRGPLGQIGFVFFLLFLAVAMDLGFKSTVHHVFRLPDFF